MQGILYYQQITNKLENYGGKASGLFFLQKNGFSVPPFYLLAYETVKSIIEQKIQMTTLVENWEKGNDIATDSIWAVRSSAAIEDGKDQSFAGLFSTQINVSPAGMTEAIGEVIKAYQQVKELNYNKEEDFEFAIIIQEMLRPDYAGVIFSHNPLDPAEEVCHINLVPGLGEMLVSGKAEAFMVTKEGKKAFSFLNAEEDFIGQQFLEGENRDVQQSGSEIKAAVSPHLPVLFDGARKLFELKGHPVDIEFAIAGNQVYWLQVRPITSREEEPILAIWDNANINENFPGLTMPLSISYTRRTYTKGYTGMTQFLGMSGQRLEQNSPLLGSMVGGIYGAVYYNVTAWQQLLYQLPFGRKTSRWITRIWNTEEADFEKPAHRSSPTGLLRLLGNLLYSFAFFKSHKRRFEDLYEEVNTSFHSDQLKGLGQLELVEMYEGIERKLAENWVPPLLNGFFAMILFTSLKKIFKRSRLFELHPNFINDILYSQGDVISVKIVKDFQTLLYTIQDDEQLSALFQENSESKILEALAKKHPQFWQEIQSYIERFGERSTEGELKLETVNYKDDPGLFITFLQSNASVTFDREKKANTFSYHQVIKEAYAYNPLKRMILLQLIRVTIPRIKDRENYRFARTKSYHIVRQIFRAIGKVIHQKGFTEAEADFLYLEYEELTNPTLAPTYKERIANRKAEYMEYEKIQHATRYAQKDSGFTAIEKSAAAFAKDTLSGTGCCSGTITAPVVVITGATMNADDIAGKIFIANHFEPGWINLFTQAAGVISERGNLLSHTAILCREMGIPSIVGVKGLMSLVQEGNLVQMNGATGEINVLENE